MAAARNSDFVFDLGANVGLVTKKLLKIGCCVYAFEPDPEAFKELEKSSHQGCQFEMLRSGRTKEKLNYFDIVTGNFQNYTPPRR